MLANRFGEHSRLRPWPPGRAFAPILFERLGDQDLAELRSQNVLLRVYVVGASIMQRRITRFDGRVRSGDARQKKKRRALGGRRPPVWSAEIRISPPDQVVKSGYILNFLHPYDVVRHGKVASRGKFQERRQRDGAPAAVEESAPPALSLIHPWRGGWRWRYRR